MIPTSVYQRLICCGSSAQLLGSRIHQMTPAQRLVSLTGPFSRSAAARLGGSSQDLSSRHTGQFVSTPLTCSLASAVGQHRTLACVPFMVRQPQTDAGKNVASTARSVDTKVPVRHSSQVTAKQSALLPNFTKAQAVQLIEGLTIEERTIFLRELKKAQTRCENGEVKRPTRQQLMQLAYHNSLPFIGFGFLDNFIMIMAGEYIDIKLGLTLGISTMTAAALGNTISDLMGIGSAWYVETLAARLGALPPDLSPTQLELGSSRIAANSGRGAGVVIGCLLGMFPLLFMDTSGHSADSEDDKEKKSSSKDDV